MLKVMGKKPVTTPAPTSTTSSASNGKCWSFARRDPNAMDVDVLSVEKKADMMRKWQCFRCGKTGHLSRDCPDKKKKETEKATETLLSYTKKEEKKKISGKDMYAHIQTLTAQLEEDEREEFFAEAEKEGF